VIKIGKEITFEELSKITDFLNSCDKDNEEDYSNELYFDNDITYEESSEIENLLNSADAEETDSATIADEYVNSLSLDDEEYSLTQIEMLGEMNERLKNEIDMFKTQIREYKIIFNSIRNLTYVSGEH